MVELLVSVDRRATLAQMDVVASELEAAGVTVTASLASLGVILGRVADQESIPRLRWIKNVHDVKEVKSR